MMSLDLPGVILRLLHVHLQIIVGLFLVHPEEVIAGIILKLLIILGGCSFGILLSLDLALSIAFLSSLARTAIAAGRALEEIADLVEALLGGALRNAKGVRDSLVVDLVSQLSARFVL